MKLTRRAATLGGLGLIATASSRALAEDGPVGRPCRGRGGLPRRLGRLCLWLSVGDDAVYPTSQRASLLEAYEGDKKYALRFEKGQLPPVKGFWSLTMYDDQMFFIANPINRYSMSMRTDPKLEPDGSLVITIQNESPGADKEANWLPSPKGKFKLMLRLYWPDEDNPSILDGSWVIPAVKRA